MFSIYVTNAFLSIMQIIKNTHSHRKSVLKNWFSFKTCITQTQSYNLMTTKINIHQTLKMDAIVLKGLHNQRNTSVKFLYSVTVALVHWNPLQRQTAFYHALEWVLLTDLQKAWGSWLGTAWERLCRKTNQESNKPIKRFCLNIVMNINEFKTLRT